MDNLKKQVGYASVDYIEDGMTVGLGTGSTAYFMVEKLGEKVNAGELSITGVTTSQQTAEHARHLNIPLKDLNDVNHIDVTIDGADEISSDFQGIKGGGGALLYEKIVASYSDKIIWIVDQSKLVDQLGVFPLPIEVVPFGYYPLLNKLEKMNYHPVLRKNEENQFFITDSGHYIIDLHLEKISDPHTLGQELKQMTGVVEHGLFLDCVDFVLVGQDGKVEKISS